MDCFLGQLNGIGNQNTEAWILQLPIAGYRTSSYRFDYLYLLRWYIFFFSVIENEARWCRSVYIILLDINLWDVVLHGESKSFFQLSHPVDISLLCNGGYRTLPLWELANLDVVCHVSLLAPWTSKSISFHFISLQSYTIVHHLDLWDNWYCNVHRLSLQLIVIHCASVEMVDCHVVVLNILSLNKVRSQMTHV